MDEDLVAWIGLNKDPDPAKPPRTTDLFRRSINGVPPNHR